eukprot:1654119-Amphidinium_carterae.1
MQGLTAVSKLGLFSNIFTGTLPDYGTRSWMSLDWFDISRNSFAGMLPEGCIRATLTLFAVNNNRLTGTLPHGGMRTMKAVTRLRIYRNSFMGALPDGMH